jgi:uncharacterized C2H2 Zn-finger protein
MGQKVLITCPHCGTSFQFDVTTRDVGTSRQCPKCHKVVHIDVRQGSVSQVRK